MQYTKEKERCVQNIKKQYIMQYNYFSKVISFCDEIC